MVPNAVIAKVGDGGKVCVFTYGTTDLLVDVNGYFPAGSSFVGLVPARLLESRSGAVTVDGVMAGIGAVGRGSVTEVQVAGRGGVPADAAAVVLNVTAVDAQVGGVSSRCSRVGRRSRTRERQLRGGSDGAERGDRQGRVTVARCACSRYGTTDLLVDVNGYFPAGRLRRVGAGAVVGVAVGCGARSMGDGGDRCACRRVGDGGAGGWSWWCSGGCGGGGVERHGGGRASRPGYFTVFPCGSAQPNASSVNYVGGSDGAERGDRQGRVTVARCACSRTARPTCSSTSTATSRADRPRRREG